MTLAGKSTAACAEDSPTPQTRYGRALSLLPGLALGLLALYPRWDRLPYITFRGDQAWSINRALDFVQYGDFPLTGIRSSVGTAQGPIELYLLAVPVAFSRDPVVATAFVALLQTIAVVVTYFFAARYFGRVAGIVAATLFAVNPWAITFARRIWTQDMLPLFAVLFIAALFGAVIDRRRYYLAAAYALAAALVLLHPSALFLLPLLAAVTLLFWRRLGLRPLLLGVLLAGLVAAPYLWGEYLAGFPSFNVYGALLGKGGGTDLGVFTGLPTLATAAYFPIMLGDGFRGDWPLPDLSVQNGVVVGLMYLGLATSLGRVAAALRFGRTRQAELPWERYLLLALWFALPALTSTRSNVPFQISYYIIFYPLQFVLAGVAVAELAALTRWARHRWRIAPRYLGWPGWLGAGVLLIFLALPQVVLFQQYLGYMERNGPRGSHGIPLLYQKQAVDTLRALRAEQPGANTYFFGSGSQGLALRYLGRPDLEVRRIDPNVGPLLPRRLEAGALAVIAPDDEGALDLAPVPADGPAARRLFALGFVEVEERAVRGPDGQVHFRFYRLPPVAGGQLPQGFQPSPRPAFLPGGLRLVGYSHPPVVRPGENTTLTLLWEIPPGLEAYRGAQEYFVFAHLVDHAGRTVGNAEVNVFANEDWRAGDIVTTQFTFALPRDEGPGLYWFDLGAFRRFGREPLPWSGDGTLLTALKVGPLKVTPPAGLRPAGTPTGFRFGDALALRGYEVVPPQPHPGQEIELRLWWQALGPPGADYTVSFQLLDPAGRLAAQHDSPPAAGAYPTAYWEPGDVVRDVHPASLSPQLPPGDYALTVVVYSSADGRLPAVGPGSATADRAVLGRVHLGGDR